MFNITFNEKTLGYSYKNHEGKTKRRHIACKYDLLTLLPNKEPVVRIELKTKYFNFDCITNTNDKSVVSCCDEFIELRGYRKVGPSITFTQSHPFFQKAHNAFLKKQA